MLCARAGKGDCSSLPTAVQLKSLGPQLRVALGPQLRVALGLQFSLGPQLRVALLGLQLRVALGPQFSCELRWDEDGASQAQTVLVYLLRSLYNLLYIVSCQGGSHA